MKLFDFLNQNDNQKKNLNYGGDGWVNWERFRKAHYLPFALMILPIISLLIFVHYYGVNILRWDEWQTLDIYHDFLKKQIDLWQLFRYRSFDNEHSMFFPRLLTFFIWHSTSCNTKAVMYSSTLLQIGSFTILFSMSEFPGEKKLWFWIPISFLMFSFRQYIDVLWGHGVAWYMITFCFFLLLWFLSLCAKASNLLWESACYLIALCSGIIASFCSIQGFLVWPSGAIYLLMRKKNTQSVWRDWRILIWAIVSIAVCAIYFWVLGFHNIGNGSGDTAHGILFFAISHPLYAFEFYVANIGAVFIGQPRGNVVAIGLVIFFIAVSSVWNIWTQKSKESFALSVALILFGLLYDGLLIGRIRAGIDYAIGPANAYYGTFIVPLIVGLYLSSHVRSSSSTNSRVRDIGWCTFFSLLVINNVYYGISQGKAIRFQRYLGAMVLLNYSHSSRLSIDRLVTDGIIDSRDFNKQAYFLRKNHLSVFAPGQGHIPQDIRERSLIPQSILSIEKVYPDSKPALERLWDVYLIAPDLQNAFNRDSPLFAQDILGWVVSEEKSKKYYLHPLLEKYEKDYILLDNQPVGPKMPITYIKFEKKYPRYTKALDQLWRVYLKAPDLQRVYNFHSPSFLYDLIQWVASEEHSTGYYLHKDLKKYGKDYIALSHIITK